MSPLDLQGLFTRLAPKRDANLLVGIETNDDAAVYRVSDTQALVLTADFITPFVDDPYLFGQIAAANSISDVYAMGGRPVAVLNLCMFPVKAGVETLAKILQGGLDKTHEAGALLVGGHTVKDDELKYGLSVTGLVDPRHYTPNSGARKDDVFILTKPVGSGVYVTGSKKGHISDEELRGVGRRIAELNKTACETMMEFDARGATDITGFGLGGHTLSMAKASKIGIRFFHGQVPTFPRTYELLDAGLSTGLSPANQAQLGDAISFADSIPAPRRTLYWDPQTSGGLFFGIRRKDVDACLKKLHERGVADARIVAEAFPSDTPRLDIVP